MIKSLIKIALRNLIKNKTYSVISISSLAIGIAVSILIFLYITQELSYDRYHEKADNIYRLCQEEHPYQAPGAANLLADNLPEIKNSTRILPRDNILVQFDNQQYKEDKVAWADAELFEIFSFEFIDGSFQNSLQRPGTAVITEKTAHKYFGDENAIGKTFKVDSEYDYTVVGVIKDIPKNSHFTFDMFLSLADGDILFGEGWMDSWGWCNFLVYFEMQDQFSKSDIETKITELMIDPNSVDGSITQYTVQNIKDIHLYSSHLLDDFQPQNSITYVLIFSAIGFLILLIACFNYINLFTANATTRVVEISIRKTFGASRKQLAAQYLSESMLVFIISFAISLILVNLSLPLFNEISGKEISFYNLMNASTLIILLGMMLFLSILAGWYPALVLSAYNPIKVVKSNKKSKGSGFQIKKILLGVQFTIVIILITSSTIMFKQINFLNNKELGFDKEAVLTSVFNFGNEAKYNTLKEALLKQDFVTSVSTASRIPSGSLGNQGIVILEGQVEQILIPYVHVNFDYFKTLGIKPIEGRLFSNEFKTDTMEAIILNKSAVAFLGLEGDPIGQNIICNWPQSTRKVVGIIDDIHFESLYNKVKPIVFVIDYSEAYHIIVKIKSSNMVSSVDAATNICQSIYPNEVISFEFVDQILEQSYQKDAKTFQLMGFFSILAIFLACIGLFGMTSFMLTSRTKEIGIRKVYGATVSEIIKLIFSDFVRWIIIAFVIATPIAYYAISIWLESFAYKTTLSLWVFALSGLIALLIALTTVSWQTYRAARKNPIESLKYE